MTEHDPNTKEPSASICGVILAGGKSRRMGGTNKALMEVGGRRLVERGLDVLRRVVRDVIVITNSPQEFAFLGLPMFRDLIPGYGSLGGLFTGLKTCGHSYGLFVACDMPFLNEGVLGHMVGLVGGGHDIIVPRIRGELEPLHAIYAATCLPYVELLLEERDLKIVDLYPHVNVLEVPEEALRRFDPTFRFVVNVNTPDDLEKARLPEKPKP